MSRQSKFIKIRGQYASGVLGTFHIIRGNASLQDLAAISAPYPMSAPEVGATVVQGHQRPINAEHAKEIKRYLQEGDLRFIPEIILSIRAERTAVHDKAGREIGVKIDVPGLTVKRPYKSERLRTHDIYVARALIEKLVTQEQRIRRIDGNHRLHLAAELEYDKTSPTRYLAPFCVILLGPPEDMNDDIVESLVFHTLNSTALPLPSEHALTLILGQPYEYSGTGGNEEFEASPDLHLTRLLREKIELLEQPHRERLGGTPATALNAAAKSLIAADPSLKADSGKMREFADDLNAGLDDILARLPETLPEFCKAEFFVELACIVWQRTKPNGDYEERLDEAVSFLKSLGTWLDREGLHKLQPRQSLAQQLYDLFCMIRTRIPKRVFLSRWYPEDSDGDEKRKADLRKQGIDQTLTDLRAEGIDLALDDPGTETGGTFGIHKEMYEALARNDIILVDLSGVRPNVCIEAGYALKHLERGRLILLFQPTETTENNPRKWDDPPFDLSTFRYEKIADTGEIPGKLKPHLKAIYQTAVNGT